MGRAKGRRAGKAFDDVADALTRGQSLSMGAALGQAIGAYRDKDTLQCAAGLVQAVELLRQAEAERDVALAAVGLLQHRINALELELRGMRDGTGQRQACR